MLNKIKKITFFFDKNNQTKLQVITFILEQIKISIINLF